MIPRYTHHEMGRIWSDQRRYETWLLVETAAAEAMAAAGIVPFEAAQDIRARGAVDIACIEEIEQTTQHDVIAFTTAVAEKVGPSARWLHFGMTSSDLIDTAQALQMRAACDLILQELDGLGDVVAVQAMQHINVQGDPAMRAERLEKLPYQFAVELPDFCSRQVHIPDQEGPRRQIKRGTHQGIVHWEQARAVSANAAFVAQCGA